MLTDQDIQKIIKANKEVFATKEDMGGLKQDVVIIKEDIKGMKDDISGLRESVQLLILSVDRFVKVAEDLSQESTMATLKMNRHEKWIRLIAEKVGVQLKY